MKKFAALAAAFMTVMNDELVSTIVLLVLMVTVAVWLFEEAEKHHIFK